MSTQHDWPIRWTYTPQEWQAFLHGEWLRNRRRMTKLMLYFGAAGLAGGLLPALGDGNIWTGVSIGIGGMLLFGGLVPGLVLLAAWLGLKRGLAGPAEVIIEPRGLRIGRRSLRWGFGGPRSVKLQPGRPAYLRIELHGRSGPDGPPSIYVAVPAGSEAEAATVRDRLRALIS